MGSLGRRLTALSPDDPHLYAVTDLSTVSLPEPGWVPVTGVIPAMVDSAGEYLSISPAVAGARLAGSLGYAVAGRLAVSLAVTERAYDTGPDSLWVRLDDDGLIERIGVRNPLLTVPAAHPTPGPAPAVRLVDLGAVISWAAEQAWKTLDPLIDELHEVTRYGRVPMWNLVADTVLGPATVAPGRAGLDQRAGRATGTAFLDALVELGAPIHRRGTLRAPDPGCSGQADQAGQAGQADQAGQPVAGELVPVRGSCCLHFRQSQEKCASCPLIKMSPA